MCTRPSNSTYISRCVNVDSRLHWRSVARRTCQLRHASIICVHAIVWVVSPRDRSRRTGRCGVNTRSSAPSSKQPNSISDSCSHARPGGQGSDLEICVYHGIWPGRRCTRSPAPRPSSQTWSVTARAAAGDAHAARAARVHYGWLITAAVEQGCRGALRCSSPPRFFSRPVRRSACAAPLLPPRAGERALHERAPPRLGASPSPPRTPDPEAAVAWFGNICVARRDARARRAAAPTHGAFSSRAEASSAQQQHHPPPPCAAPPASAPCAARPGTLTGEAAAAAPQPVDFF